MKVQDFMSHGVRTVRQEDALSRAAQEMWDGDCGIVPVVEEDGRVVGMLTDRDICMAAYTQGRPIQSIPVVSAMAKQVHDCRPDDSVAAAERTMREQHVRRLPVIDDGGRLVGLLSLNDIAIEAVLERKLKQGDVSPDEVGITLAAVCEHRARRPEVVSPV